MRLRSGDRAVAVIGDARSAELREGRRIGEMLQFDAATISAVAAHQARTGKLFGEAAVDMGVVTDDQVQRAVEAQQGFSVLADDDQRLDPLVVSAFDPADGLALSVRSLRALISGAKRADGHAVQSVAMLGLDAGAETPVLAANLAVAFAQTGYRTLLVDGDLINPQHHALFRLRNRAGLTTVLSNASRAETVSQATAITGLAVMTSGPGVPNASELLDRRRLAGGLDSVRDDYDMVLVDVGDQVENGISASLGLDATIIVVRRDITETRMLSRVVDRLEAGGMTILGTILVD